MGGRSVEWRPNYDQLGPYEPCLGLGHACPRASRPAGYLTADRQNYVVRGLYGNSLASADCSPRVSSSTLALRDASYDSGGVQDTCSVPHAA